MQINLSKEVWSQLAAVIMKDWYIMNETEWSFSGTTTGGWTRFFWFFIFSRYQNNFPLVERRSIFFNNKKCHMVLVWLNEIHCQQFATQIFRYVLQMILRDDKFAHEISNDK